jgi:glycosyltransferase involved in cell wall biosynthesis
MISRYLKRDIDVGLGPLPLINNVYHKKALQQAGFSAETFVSKTFFITDEFDLDLTPWQKNAFLKRCVPYYLFCRALFRYRVLFIYFNGGPLLPKKYVLHALEPIFYKLAKLKIVVMPYGGDIQVLTRTKNLYFRHTMTRDYPKFFKYYTLNRKNIDRWTWYANWVIGSGDNVEYMYHWDTLMLVHFSIDAERWAPVERKRNNESSKLRILHAPNHPMIKGTDALIKATELLKSEGLDLELILLRGVPNDKIRKAMAEVDLVADQFVMGWYAMFAIEAMAMGKPVLCYLREDFVELYVKAGLVTEGEIPLINTDMLDIASKIRWAYDNREELRGIGEKGREFVQKHHSTEHVGRIFAEILNKLGIRAQ